MVDNPDLHIPLLMQNKVPEGFETDDKLDVSLRPSEVINKKFLFNDVLITERFLYTRYRSTCKVLMGEMGVSLSVEVKILKKNKH